MAKFICIGMVFCQHGVTTESGAMKFGRVTRFTLDDSKFDSPLRILIYYEAEFLCLKKE